MHPSTPSIPSSSSYAPHSTPIPTSRPHQPVNRSRVHWPLCLAHAYPGRLAPPVVPLPLRPQFRGFVFTPFVPCYCFLPKTAGEKGNGKAKGGETGPSGRDGPSGGDAAHPPTETPGVQKDQKINTIASVGGGLCSVVVAVASCDSGGWLN